MFQRVWAQQRREGRRAWRLAVEAAAADLAGLSGGGAAAAAAAARRAREAESQEEEEDDEDGMGDPPEAKALLEELGQRQPAAAAAPRGGAPLPPPRGAVAALSTLALGAISLAAAGAAGAGDAADALALRVPPLASLVTGVPARVNVEAGFVEDLAADAAAHNAGLAARTGGAGAGAGAPLLLPAPAGAGAGAPAAGRGPGALADAAAAAAPAAPAAAPAAAGAATGGAPALHAPPLELESLEGLRLILAAGWALAHDARRRDGRLAGAVLSHQRRQAGAAMAAAAAAGAAGGPGDAGGARVAMTEDGELALRLRLEVAERARVRLPPGAPAGAAAAAAAFAAAAAGGGGAAGGAGPLTVHQFDLGVHLNLSRLIADPSEHHADALSAEVGGPGSAARGLLLIGDLGLALEGRSGGGGGGGAWQDMHEEEREEEDAMRPPPLGFRWLPLSRTRDQRGGGAA